MTDAGTPISSKIPDKAELSDIVRTSMPWTSRLRLPGGTMGAGRPIAIPILIQKGGGPNANRGGGPWTS